MKNLKKHNLQLVCNNHHGSTSSPHCILTRLRSYALTVFFLLSPHFLSAQVSHEFSITGGGGASTLNYKLSQGKKTLGFGGDAGLGYTCIFIKMVGIHIGAEVGFYSANANFDGAEVVTQNLTDSDGDRFNMHTTLSQYKETQNAMFLNIPVMVQFQIGMKHKFYAMGGIKIGIPLSSKYKGTAATLTNKGYYPEYENWMTMPEFAGFGTFSQAKTEGKLKLGITATLSLEAGGKWKLGEKFALYTGVYFDYGLNNILKVNNQPFVNYKATLPATFTTNSALPSLTHKINVMAVGIKLRFAFNLRHLRAF